MCDLLSTNYPDHHHETPVNGKSAFRVLVFADYGIIHGKSQSEEEQEGTDALSIRPIDSLYGQ